MIKSGLLLFVLTLSTFSSFGQELFDGEIRWGEPTKLKKKEYGPDPIGTLDGSFYATKTTNSFGSHHPDVAIQTFGLKSLALENETELDLTYQDFDLTIISSFVFSESVIFITKYVDKKEKKQHYLLHELENGTELGKPIELAETALAQIKLIGARKSMEKAKAEGAYSFRYVVSDDYESMLISFQNENQENEVILFDKNIDEVSRTTMELPYEKFQVESRRLTNSGRYCMVGYEVKTGESEGLIKREIDIAGDYHIIIHDAVNGDLEDIELEISKDIVSVAIKVMPDESTVAYGMYSNEDAKGISGAFFQKISKDHSIEFTTLEEFEEDFITQHWTDRQKKKAAKKKKSKNPKKAAEPSLYSYIMHDLAVKENGDLMLLAEQYYMYVTTRTTTDANGNSHTTYTYHYIYNDIIAVNCTEKGEITWKDKVKKRQHSINDGGYYSSFYTLVQGSNVFLMYNDKEANMDDAEESTSSLGKRQQKRNTVAALITLTDEGEMLRETLFDFEEDESRVFVPKRCERMSDNEVLLFAEMKSKGTISFSKNKRTKILGWLTL